MNKLTLILWIAPFLLFSQGKPEQFLESAPEPPFSVCNSKRDFKEEYLTKVDKVLEDIQAEKSKEEELENNSMDDEKMLKLNSAAVNGNISTEDLKKMEGMSDEEQAVFIQKLMKEAMKNPEKNSPQNTEKKVGDLKRRRNEQATFTAEWSKRLKGFGDSLQAIKDDADIFYYDNKINEMKIKLARLTGEGDNTNEAIGLADKINSLCVQYCDIFSGRLLFQLRDYKEYIKSQLSNIRKYEKNVYEKSGTGSQDLAALSFIIQYIEKLKTVFDYDLLGEKTL